MHFVRRRVLWWPTWPTWFLMAALLVVVTRIAAPGLYDLMSPCDDGEADILAVEGWLPDHAVSEVIRLIERHEGPRVFTTGGPVERGGYLQEWRTYAEAARATLLATGAPTQRIIAVPAPDARTDRTFVSALALRRYLDELGVPSGRVSVITLSAHALRSRALFQRALGPRFVVRTRPYHSPWFGRNDWWTTSEGFRFVTGEAIAALHNWLRPPRRPFELADLGPGTQNPTNKRARESFLRPAPTAPAAESKTGHHQNTPGENKPYP